MSINGVGANGNGPQKIDPKQVEQKKTLSSAIKGFAEGAIGKLLGGNKAEAEDKPIKGLSIEHTGTTEYTGGSDGYGVTGSIGYTHNGQVSYQGGPVEYQANGQVGYQGGIVGYTAGDVGYQADGTVDYQGGGTVGYQAGGTTVYQADGIAGYQASGSIGYTATGTVGYDGIWEKWENGSLVDYGTIEKPVE